jgi:hypothetical protein
MLTALSALQGVCRNSQNPLSSDSMISYQSPYFAQLSVDLETQLVD